METAVEYFQIADEAERCQFSTPWDASQWAAASVVVAAEMENGEIAEEVSTRLSILRHHPKPTEH